MTEPNEYVLTSPPSNRPGECGQMIWPHGCRLSDCPRDDPTWVHECYADDFDWREGDFVEYRLGRIDIAELLTRGFTLVQVRLHGRGVVEGSSSYSSLIKSKVMHYLECVKENEAQGVRLKADTTGIHAVYADGTPASSGEVMEP